MASTPTAFSPGRLLAQRRTGIRALPGTGTLSGGFVSTKTASQQAAYVQEATEVRNVRGETCKDSQRRDWRQRRDALLRAAAASMPGLTGGILNEGPRYHLAHINVSYADNFLAAWSAGGCLDTVNRMMGYRMPVRRHHAPDQR